MTAAPHDAPPVGDMTPEAFIAFARSLPEPMALTDERGRVMASNAAARDFVVRCAPAPRCAISRPTDRACASGWPPAATPAASSRPPCRCAATTARWSTSASRRPRCRRRDRRRAGRCCCASARGLGAQEQALHRRGALPRAVLERRARHLPLPRRRHHPRRQPGAGGDARPRSPESLVGEAGRHLRRARRFLTLLDRIRHAGRALSVDANWRRRNGDPLGVRLSRRFETGAARTASSSCWSRTRPSAGRSRRSSRDQDGVDRPLPAASPTTSTTC